MLDVVCAARDDLLALMLSDESFKSERKEQETKK